LTGLGWSYGPILFNENNASIFGKYVSRRYPFLPKILGGDSSPEWFNAGEIRERYVAAGQDMWEPRDPAKPFVSWDNVTLYDTRELWNNMAEAMLEVETPLWEEALSGGKPFMTYHASSVSLPGQAKATAANYFGDKEWLTMDAVQSGHTDMDPNVVLDPPFLKWEGTRVWEPLTIMWNSTRARPILDLESHCTLGPDSRPADQ